jgi:hypothetical protein
MRGSARSTQQTAGLLRKSTEQEGLRFVEQQPSERADVAAD